MCEVKFRAWDKKLKTMYPIISLTKLLHYLFSQSESNSNAYVAIKDHFNDIIWEQCTGLKDKNGKEICEGDILEICCSNTKQVIPYVVDDIRTYYFHVNSDGYLRIQEEKSKIIGNIHENPELIKGE